MNEPVPDMIPGRVPHRQAPWYRALAVIAAVLIALMIGVTCIDVIGRYLMNRPFGGAYELTQILLAALVFVALPLTTADGGHVEVDLALHLFPKPVQRLMGRLAGWVSALALGYFAWRLALIGLDQWHEGTRSASLMLPMAPLAFLAAASCAVSAIILLLPRKETP
ncbi:TRAP transporter small permease [Paracoccus lutimaris]|uniref:TRAP transporter small permease protein n=1 Tax=Paracoccus lutimaris TaxID=1490030 RepID=A0A368Z430_9RHOB|nr:TRAP transporter small permease [Paracoccus lutimaris]RCW87213.1 TRAP-type C4-dicarboxylate transport system permease small subunit [Paracoccus lutimaris]